LELPYSRSRPWTDLSRAGESRLALLRRALPYAVIVLLPIALLAPSFGVQLDRDEGAYYTVAIGMRHGLVPYADLFDHKPPLIYGVYWLSLLAGGGLWQPRLLAALSFGFTGIMVSLCARELRFGRWQSIAAGLIFGLSTSNVTLQSNANTEAFMILPMTAALWTTLRAAREPDVRWYLATGALVAVATLFKTPAAVTGVPLAVYLFAVTRRGRLRAVAWCAAGGLSVFAACATVFALTGALDALWYANVTYNRFYGNATSWATRIDEFWRIRPDIALGGLLFWLLALAGILVAARRHRHYDVLLLAWAAASYAGIKLTGRQTEHYYVQLLPAAALAGAVGASAMLTNRRARIALGVVALPLVAWHVAIYSSYAVSPVTHAKLHDNVSYDCEAASPAIAAWLSANTAPGDRIYNFGRESELYYYAGRLPAARFMYDRPFYLDPATLTQTLAALEVTRPRIIVETAACEPGEPLPAAATAYLASDYHQITTIGPANIYEIN
jgi:4-amino-4-deoxy-L-arabinose transferase-like glycosyltransferase